MPELPNVPMHQYECAACILAFAVEAHEDIDHSLVVCPLCQNDLALSDVGTGEFQLITLAEVDEQSA